MGMLMEWKVGEGTPAINPGSRDKMRPCDTFMELGKKGF